jgi:hypothetical protein
MPARAHIWVCAAEFEGLNAAEVVAAVGAFINKLAEMEAEDLRALESEEKVWRQAGAIWEEAGGCPVSVDVLRRLHARFSEPCGQQLA